MKYKFEGIGEASASVIMAGLASNPSTLVFTQGFLGKVVFFVLKLVCMLLASLGLIIMNVGAAKIDVIVSEGKYDKSWDNAEELIKKIRDQGRELTDEEIKQIDGPVMDAWRKFGSFARVRKPTDT